MIGNSIGNEKLLVETGWTINWELYWEAKALLLGNSGAKIGKLSRQEYYFTKLGITTCYLQFFAVSIEFANKDWETCAVDLLHRGCPYPILPSLLHPGPSDTRGPQHWTWRHLPAPRQRTSSLRVTKIEAIHRAPLRQDILRCHVLICCPMLGRGLTVWHMKINKQPHIHTHTPIHPSLTLYYIDHHGTTSACKSKGRVLFTAFGTQIMVERSILADEALAWHTLQPTPQWQL